MTDSSLCSGCGAVLPLADSEGRVSCPSCGRQLRLAPPAPDPAHARPGVVTVDLSDLVDAMGDLAASSPGTTATSTPARPAATGRGVVRGIGCLVAILAVVGGAVALVLAAGSATDTVRKALSIPSSLSPSGSVSVLPGAAGQPGDLVEMVYDSKSNTRGLARIHLDASGSKVVWKTPALPGGVSSVVTAMAGDRLYVGAGDAVLALSTRTGAEAWRAELSDKVTTGCPSCFVTVGDGLVVRTDDAQVSSFGPASAEPRWTRRFTSTSGTLVPAGGLLALVDDGPEAGGGSQVTTVDSATGAVRSTVTPRCPETAERPWAIALSSFDAVYAVPGSTDLVTAFGTGDGCAVRWDGASGTARWTTPLKDLGSIDRDTGLVEAGQFVVATNSSGLVRLDLANGQRTPLALPADVTATPAMVVGKLLIAETTTTRGTTRGGLAAWDLTSAKLVWDVKMPRGAQTVSRGRYRSSDALFEGSPRSLLAPLGEGLALVTFEGTDRTYTVQGVDLATGALAPATARSFGSGSGTPSLTVEAVEATRLVISVDSTTVLIPLQGIGEVISWPHRD